MLKVWVWRDWQVQIEEGSFTMKKLSIIALFMCIIVLTVGCRVAFVVVEGGEVQYTDIEEVLHTCGPG